MLDTPEPLVLNPADNVAILTSRAPQGARPLGLGDALSAPVASGHKIARAPIGSGESIVKFGQVIGYATRDIAPGEHVHTQNCGFGAHDQEYQSAPIWRPLALRSRTSSPEPSRAIAAPTARSAPAT